MIRGGTLFEFLTPELVPGDLVVLAAGDVVPADLRLVDVHGLRVNEAALTGESESSAKTVDTLPATDWALVADRHNMAFKGTSVTYERSSGPMTTARSSTPPWAGSASPSSGTLLIPCWSYRRTPTRNRQPWAPGREART